jgi:hypothetical protein
MSLQALQCCNKKQTVSTYIHSSTDMQHIRITTSDVTCVLTHIITASNAALLMSLSVYADVPCVRWL